ncbi:MAG: serine/threonine protein kinase [Cyanobacteria bacterium]|nr:serine/threonine protein kinase [Cyanobacteriota bacterium]
MTTMESPVAANCELCLRPIIAPGSAPVTQWVSFCKCNRTYSPNAQFSIDWCRKCKKRVVKNATVRVERRDLCSCNKPDPRTIPNYLKQTEHDSDELDLAAIAMTPENFPLERYKPLGILGEGPRANVILARDKSRGSKVAVKCFKGTTPDVLGSFEQECKKNAKLAHAFIAKTVDFGILNRTTPYIVTEYKDGFNLEQYLAMHGVPSHDVTVMILQRVCEALLYAQKESFLHKDLRPGNIIFLDDLNADPAVSLTDFSFTNLKLHKELASSEDAQYMSSDEARNMEYSEKSEVYSLGCVGFALLTGRPPFQTGTAIEIKNAHALKLPPRVSDLNFEKERPKDLEEVIERCLEKDSRNRFESVSKFLERLEVFPRRDKARIDAILAARKKAKIMRIAIIAVIVIVFCTVVLLFVVH